MPVKIFLEDYMRDCLVCMALGFIAGAVLVTSNSDAKRIVEKGKRAVKDQVKKITE